MWKKKRGVWVLDEGEKRVADRPHWLTLAVGVFSSVLALSALVVSLNSLRTSERSLMIGTRAYVAVLSGELKFFNYGIVGQHCIVRMDLSATFQNAGNSPASSVYFKAKYRLPPGWSEAPAWVKQNLGSPSISSIGPKSTVSWSYTSLFELTPDTYDEFRNWPGQRFIYMDAEVDFKDVFDERSAVRWCWAAATNERKTKTTDCESALKLVLGRGGPPDFLSQ